MEIDLTDRHKPPKGLVTRADEEVLILLSPSVARLLASAETKRFRWYPSFPKKVRILGVSTGRRFSPAPFAYFSNYNCSYIHLLTWGTEPHETT
jgi:hypothetical protein